jgi:hypothetical protein
VAILLGVATALVAQKDQLPGEVMFVFQPAEEGPPVAGAPFGAKLMLDEGVFKDFKPEAVFGLHVWAGLQVGEVGYRSGPMLASADEWSLTVRGKQTHGSRPWDGVDPITVGAQILLASQSLIARQINIAATPVVLTAGQFNAGVRFNIIPDEAKLVGDQSRGADFLLAQLGVLVDVAAPAHDLIVDRMRGLGDPRRVGRSGLRLGGRHRRDRQGQRQQRDRRAIGPGHRELHGSEGPSILKGIRARRYAGERRIRATRCFGRAGGIGYRRGPAGLSGLASSAPACVSPITSAACSRGHAGAAVPAPARETGPCASHCTLRASSPPSYSRRDFLRWRPRSPIRTASRA